MPLSIITVITILICTVLVMVLLPLFKGKSEDVTIYHSEVEHEKERLFSQLSDLEYDYYMKKISHEDYEQSKSELTAKVDNLMDQRPWTREQLEKEVDEEIRQYLSADSMRVERGNGT